MLQSEHWPKAATLLAFWKMAHEALRKFRYAQGCLKTASVEIACKIPVDFSGKRVRISKNSEHF